MAKDHRSFFERLTGAVRFDDYEDEIPHAPQTNERNPTARTNNSPDLMRPESNHVWPEDNEEEGELSVDVYQDDSEIVIKTMVAGVKPDDLDVTITRDMVTIKGKRETEKAVDEGDYLHKELYWGTFSRTIVLPAEIDVDMAEAIEKHGLLIIKLPKINKNRQTKVKVRG